MQISGSTSDNLESKIRLWTLRKLTDLFGVAVQNLGPEKYWVKWLCLPRGNHSCFHHGSSDRLHQTSKCCWVYKAKLQNSSFFSPKPRLFLWFEDARLWGLLPVPEAAGRSNAPARLFKGCILGMFWDELPRTWLCLMSITLVQPVSADARKQLWTSACLYDLGKPKMNPLCQARSQHMTQELLCLSVQGISLGRSGCPSLSGLMSGLGFLLRENNLNSLAE